MFRCRSAVLSLAIFASTWVSGSVAGTDGVRRLDLSYPTRSGDRRILVFEPVAPGPRPLVVLVPGTGNAPGTPIHKAYMESLAARGYVVAGVDYNRFFRLISCHSLGNKARRIFDLSDPHSAVNLVYRKTLADPRLGIGVIGMSQGSWVAHQARHYTGDVDVKAALLLSTGTQVRMDTSMIDTHLRCNERGYNRIPRVLAIDGEADSVYTRSDPGLSRRDQLRAQLAKVTGMTCTGLSCYDPVEGSGWLLVPSQALEDGQADHQFESLGGMGGKTLDPIWARSDEPWGLRATVDWLDRAMRDQP